MKLPNGERADLGVKLEDYVQNPLHREGQHKAHVFASVLGITLDNAQVLRNALLDAAVSSDNVGPRGNNGFGSVYVLRFPLATAQGAATVLSAWIIRHGEDFPRLTTCYIV
ncbi:MAG: hypothetical protein IPL99_24100 [Candidatus Competibacteraceae bacterium]|nr:hypothetical protein [Candidatus Competibacteraceae bacterium]